MNVYQLSSFEEFKCHWQRSAAVRAERRTWQETLCAPYRENRANFEVKGFSYPALQTVPFKMDWVSSSGPQPNWRERMICPLTNLNTRLRATLHLIDSHCGLYRDSSVYLTEQVTPLFPHLLSRFASLVGSEYIGPDFARGQTDARGIRHEDLTRLSFESGAFDSVMSFECFEHIPDYRTALSECFRILKPGGQILFTVPFKAGEEPHTIRARIKDNGEVEHLMEPEYHGDPMQSAGCLCFTHFGWNLLGDLREVGFSRPHALAVWSKEFGYLGEELLFFRAEKQK